MVLLALALAGCRRGGPPSTPYLFGPAAGQPAETLQFRAVARDPGRGNLSYMFDWGDGSVRIWTAEHGSGDTFALRYVFRDTGGYAVAVRCRNESRLESDWSAPLEVRVGFRGPVTPDPPVGPGQGRIDTALTFTASAEHVRGESVQVQFDWEDTLGDWSEFAPAGVAVNDSHRFRRAGLFCVRARARDRAGNTSPWSETQEVLIELKPLAPPANLRLSSVIGIQVKVRWDQGANEDSVRYGVWFRAGDSSGFVMAGEVAGRYLTHDPAGATGYYTVSARRLGEEVFAAETLSTVPVFTDTLVVHELNGDSANAYGWDMTSGLGRLGTMLDTTRAGLVDWYFTDLTPGYVGPAFYLASPQYGPEDPGGVVPAGPWRSTRMMGVLGSPQDPLPEYDSLFYQRVVDVSSFQANVAVHTPEGYYALVSTYAPNPDDGTVRAISWFQRIPGLRLIRHPEPPPK